MGSDQFFVTPISWGKGALGISHACRIRASPGAVNR